MLLLYQSWLFKSYKFLIHLLLLAQTIHGDPNTRVSSLIWCPGGSSCMPCGRLFSSNMDGSVSKWDIFHLKQKV